MIKDKYVGDPVDVAMFRATNWAINENLNEYASLLNPIAVTLK